MPPTPRRQAPGPLLAAMGTTTAILVIAAFVTGQWAFLVLALIGLAVGLVPILGRR